MLGYHSFLPTRFIAGLLKRQYCVFRIRGSQRSSNYLSPTLPSKKCYKAFNYFSEYQVYSQLYSGILKDENGPLQRASIFVKSNPKIGATTNVNGRYTLTVPQNSVLIFSFKGFQSMKIPVKGKSIVDATLQSENAVLNDVVVVGYPLSKDHDL